MVIEALSHLHPVAEVGKSIEDGGFGAPGQKVAYITFSHIALARVHEWLLLMTGRLGDVVQMRKKRSWVWKRASQILLSASILP